MNKTVLSILTAFTSTVVSPAIYAETDTDPPEAWKCSSCPDPSQKQQIRNINFGLGWLSNDSFAFGQSNGVAEEGVYVLLDGEFYYQKNEKRIEFIANDLGLDKRSFSLDINDPGKYRVGLSGQVMPSYKSDTTYTPYHGVDTLSPSPGWQPGSTTANFTNLSDELVKTDWFSNRKKVSLDFRYVWNPSLESDINFTRSSKRGNQPLSFMIGSSFFDTAANLLAPQNHETKSVSVSLQRKKPSYQWSLQYELSQFYNDQNSIRWSNLFDTPNVDSGQAALAPDNQFHQLSWQASYNAIKDWIYTAALSYGLSQQNEAFLPGSINPNQTATISANSLDGKINSGSILINALYQHSPKQRYDFRYRYTEQDNQTNRITSQYVIADSLLLNEARSSRPYSFRNQSISGKSRTKLSNNQYLTAFADYRIYNREYQSLRTGREGRIWLQFQHRVKNGWDYSAKLVKSKRTGSDYKPRDDLFRPENSLLRKYNMAGRKQNQVIFSGTRQYMKKWTSSISINSARDAYDAEIGLQKAGHSGYNLDLQYLHSASLSLSFYWNLQKITASQKGETTVQQWIADHEDTIYTQGLNVSYEWRKDKLYLDFDIVQSRSVGRIDVDNEPFPDLTISRINYKLGVNYKIKENMTAEGFFEYESYDESDWARDDVNANSVENVLGLGEVPPDYDIGHIGVSLHYTF